jgi:hypothetical protein
MKTPALPSRVVASHCDRRTKVMTVARALLLRCGHAVAIWASSQAAGVLGCVLLVNTPA